VETLNVSRVGGVVTVTLNRPERMNALTGAMLEELGSALEEVACRAHDRVLVLTGAGGEFCSGADLSGADRPTIGDAPSALELVRRMGDVALSLHRLAKPTIAKVDGVAVGAGLGLALACDLVVASERARLSMIFVRRAMSPDCGTSWLLPRLVGTSKAKELAFFGEIVDAETALRLGLVNRVVPQGDLDTAVGVWAAKLAEGPALALSTGKTLLDSAWSSSFADALEHEAVCQSVNFAGTDVREAMAAFVEKREPHFGAP
jgi:enoyl-CoA hydratase/carnithine racemase